MIINNCFKVRSFILAAVLGGFGFLSPDVAQADSFIVDINSKTWTWLDHLPDEVTSINNAGQVVGFSFMQDGPNQTYNAFITGPNGMGMRDLGTLGGAWTFAYDINDAGEVTGSSTLTAESATRAFITGPNGIGMRELDTPFFTPAWGYGINEAGQVAGASYPHAFITGPNGMGMRDLGTLVPEGGEVPYTFSWANAINDSGQVAGAASLTSESVPYHAIITGSNGVGMRDLGTLGGDISGASSINNAGEVAGTSLTTEGVNHAFVTGPNGTEMKDLGTLGGNESWASDINEAGQVVGSSEVSRDVRHAFITGLDGTGMTDLNSLVDLPEGVILNNAISINDRGQVLVSGIVPIPEPETYALMLAGLGLIGFMARRKKVESLIKRY